jgi:mannose-6-phosphate isomerase-like protein (cupin superfamily)
MSVFRSGEATVPAWCELEHFEVIDLKRGEAAMRERRTREERVIVTRGTARVRVPGGAIVLKEAQFLDLPEGRLPEGPFVVDGISETAQLVRLCGRWGAEMGGCGIFRAKVEAPRAPLGDPVAYAKRTAIDSHYHDCDEYWVILEGSGTVVIDDRHLPVKPGDCVAIRMGHHHDFPDVESEVKAVFFETTLAGAKRIGHLWNHTHGRAQPQPLTEKEYA